MHGRNTALYMCIKYPIPIQQVLRFYFWYK